MRAVKARPVAFYGGAVQCAQPDKGYRAGTDALLLAAAVKLPKGGTALELGCGTGVILKLADYRLPGRSWTGLERDPDMLALARENTVSNANIHITKGNVAALPKIWHLQYDCALANPPFFDNPAAIRHSPVKAAAFVAGDTRLADWLSAMLLALKPRGYGYVIHRADALPEIIIALAGKAGALRILPIHSYADLPAKRVIVRFRKGVRSETALLAPLVMHERGGAARYAAKAQAILGGTLSLELDK